MPDNVFLAKGFIRFGGSSLRHIFHLSRKRFNIIDDVWKGQPKTKLVLIGHNFETEKFCNLVSNCLAYFSSRIYGFF